MLLFHTCFIQGRKQLGTPRGAKVFLGGDKNIEICPIVENFVQHVFPGETKKFPRGLLSPCAPSNGPGFFIHNTNQVWVNLFNGRFVCRKPKKLASRKTPVCSVNTNTVKNASFTLNDV